MEQAHRQANGEIIHQWNQSRERLEHNKAILEHGIKERNKFLGQLPTSETMLPTHDGSHQGDTKSKTDTAADDDDDKTKDTKAEDNDTDVDASLTMDESGTILATCASAKETSRKKKMIEAMMRNELEDLLTRQPRSEQFRKSFRESIK